ncbi:MAG TPA: hypothetical protein VE684_22220 [Crenalkalicoccus sp.]|jgi:hypothetical protein|nr:hypothetical protein [Crenalkalicoccus sp.]
MRGRGENAIRAGVLAFGLTAALAGCQRVENGLATATDKFADAGGGMFWGSPKPGLPDQSLTVDRVAYGDARANTLRTEPGDVWPGPLPPRATLANPDAALRDIPEYRPGDRRYDRPSWDQPLPPQPQLESTLPQSPSLRGLSQDGRLPPPGSTSRGAPNQLRGSSSPPPPPLQQPPLPETQPPLANLPEYQPQPQLREGQVIPTPGGPVTLGAGSGAAQTFIGPDGSVGTVTRQGGNLLLTPSAGGPPQVVPVPR